MGTAVHHTRSFPFGEHRTMAQVIETDDLADALRSNRVPADMRGAWAKRYYSLKSRQVLIDEPPEIVA